jgi:hypothetical protein
MAPLSEPRIVRDFMLGVQTEVELWGIAREEKAVRVQLLFQKSCPQEGAWEKKH